MLQQRPSFDPIHAGGVEGRGWGGVEGWKRTVRTSKQPVAGVLSSSPLCLGVKHATFYV